MATAIQTENSTEGRTVDGFIESAQLAHRLVDKSTNVEHDVLLGRQRVASMKSNTKRVASKDYPTKGDELVPVKTGLIEDVDCQQ